MELEIKPGQFQKLLRKFVYGGKEASEAVAKAAMKKLADERARKFQERVAKLKEIRKHQQIIYAPLAELLSKDEKAKRASRAIREIHLKSSKQKRVRPTVPARKARVFTGSISGAVVAPCWFTYIETSVSANPTCKITADALTGEIGFDLQSDPNNYSHATAQVMLGFYFYPPANGSLSIQAFPSYMGNWYYTYYLQGVDTSAWAGIIIQQLDLNNDPKSMTQLFSYQNSLWEGNSSGLWGDNGGQPSSDLMLSGGCNVDTNHHYIIYVACGGKIDGGGGINAGGSSLCYSGLTMVVPSIDWTVS